LKRIEQDEGQSFGLVGAGLEPAPTCVQEVKIAFTKKTCIFDNSPYICIAYGSERINRESGEKPELSP
jgi:hypothetical protein